MIPLKNTTDKITPLLLSTIQRVSRNLLDMVDEAVLDPDDHFTSPQGRAELRACIQELVVMSPSEALFRLRTSVHLWNGPRGGTAIRLQMQYAESLRFLMELTQ